MTASATLLGTINCSQPGQDDAPAEKDSSLGPGHPWVRAAAILARGALRAARAALAEKYPNSLAESERKVREAQTN